MAELWDQMLYRRSEQMRFGDLRAVHYPVLKNLRIGAYFNVANADANFAWSRDCWRDHLPVQTAHGSGESTDRPLPPIAKWGAAVFATARAFPNCPWARARAARTAGLP
ncbi:MAG: hypothetical protein R2867_32440 [Caldilineaceae bacterium]